MTPNMSFSSDHDYIRSYEHAVAALKLNPHDRDLQHKIVLSLARTGALDFAQSEYTRFGLHNVSGHEDIMALAGRLSKDLYLRSESQKDSERDTLIYAREAAEKYDVAFQDSKGFYSGINAATMALMANMPPDIITARIEAILDLLPSPEMLTPTEHYFMEATRAECFLLSGDISKARATLRGAIQFDPMNYAAHATTIKQFKMICSKRGEDCLWLSEFNPPRPIHYAGHIELSLTHTKLDALKINVADHIQKNDIGLGYGALAAGSDIILAEALLEEGAELHIILPCESHIFIEHSVKPFGANWLNRYNVCLKAAQTVRVMSQKAQSLTPQLTRTSGQFAIGQAILMGQYLNVRPAQMLIWDKQPKTSYTAIHAEDWAATDQDYIHISPHKDTQEPRQQGPALKDIPLPSACLLKRSDTHATETFSTAIETVKAALEIRRRSPGVKLALHINIEHEDSSAVLETILSRTAPKGILSSDVFAGLLAFSKPHFFNMSFAGFIETNDHGPLRCYAVNA